MIWIELSTIVERYPDLGEALDVLGREMNTEKETDGPGFNTQEALRRLNERLRNENLL